MSLKQAILFFFAALLLAGCGSGSVPPTTTAVNATEAQIKAIQDNPNMPQAQKDAITSRLKQQGGSAEVLKQNSQNGK